MFNIYLGIYFDKNGDRCDVWRNCLDGEHTAIEENGRQIRLGIKLPKEYKKEDL